jgi:hypothetical protein
MQKGVIEEITIEPEALAALAASSKALAARRQRPVSKQIHLGRKTVERQGWGGGPGPLEMLSRRLCVLSR